MLDELKSNLSVAACKNINNWLNEAKYAEYKPDLIQMIEEKKWSDLEDAFFKVIEFGTGGRRGTTGVGSNRINRVTIGESTQALCQYAQSADEKAPEKGVVIACDTRLSSPELSQYAAQVAAANGFKTYIFDSFRSTPELSFAVRHLDCAIGIVISASHNPPADNGFKAYWNDGGQLVAPHDKGVLAMAEQVTEIKATADFSGSVKSGAINMIGRKVDDAYLAAVLNESENDARDLNIIYSPLHGAGQTNVLPVLRQAGFTNVSEVTSQMTPDGNFPTVENGKPNPEEKSANKHAVNELLAKKFDIAITNDPDADRFGVIVRQNDEAFYLNGNQAFVLMVDYVLSALKKRGDLTSNHYVAKTIVTTELVRAIADKYDVTTYSNMLIGFKYIGNLILQKENSDEIFVIGGEESFGALKGTYARDKDGASASLAVAECAAELKASGKTMVDRLMEIYHEHGFYMERLDTLVRPGADGFSEMQKIMTSLRDNAPSLVAGQQVTARLDYADLTRTDISTGLTSTIDCDKGNVIVYEFNNDSRCRVTIRPSGTEPKLKFYVQWFEESKNVSDEYDKINQKLENISRELESIALARV